MRLDQIKAIVFDLDGTLYEDTHHFDYYANRLKEKLPPEVQSQFKEDYDLIMDNYHPLKIGRLYDVKRDLIIVQVGYKIREAFDWEGRSLSRNEIERLYQKPLLIDQINIISIGDPWWVPSTIAVHYGLGVAKLQEAFLETRAYMMGDQFTMAPILGLKETLAHLFEQTKMILMTNSPQPDSEAILKKLGIIDYFHDKIYLAEKPTRTKERLTAIATKYNINCEEILCIGDNWTNDILPAQELGCQTAFIDPHGIGDEESADLVVEQMIELFPLFRRIG